MANRKTHNKIASMLVKLPYSEIDDVNAKVDDIGMLRKYGRYHRQHWGHNPDGTAPDSLAITRGNAKREMVRRIHIVVDTNPKIKAAVKRMELLQQVKRRR
jgi:hypothetical protein